MKKILGLVLIFVMAVQSLHAAHDGSVGLVLSGGGAKGIAHIGIIQALEDNDIPIDYITGTSMGAIVGGLYASGYSPAEMLELLGSQGFSDWSTGKIDKELTFYLMQPTRTPAFFNLNVGVSDSSKITSVLPTSLINPLPMNFAFMELFSAYTAQCGEDFNRLFVPFRCVTSNVFEKHKVVLSHGDLGDAVRMSMSFPTVFEPIELDGNPMYDGGIYDNFPVDVMMTEFSPDAVIGVDVSSHNRPDPRNMLDQLETMIMQPDDYPFPDDRGVYIHIDLSEFGLLDFPKYKEIYEIGYNRGLEMMDSIKMKIGSRTPALTRRLRREVFKSATPYVRFDSVTVTGGTPRQNAYLKSLFRHHEADTFGLAFAKEAYYRAITPGRLQKFVPDARYNPSDSIFSLDFKALVKDKFSLGLGGYISSSTNSMLFLTAGYNTLSSNSFEAGLGLWVGQSYLAAVGETRLLFPSAMPSAWVFQVEASQHKFNENEKMFFEINAPNFVTKSEVFARTFYTIATARRAKAEAGIGYGHLTDRFYARESDGVVLPNRAWGIFDLGSVFARWEFNTLDNVYAPTSGTNISALFNGVFGRFRHKSRGEGIPNGNSSVKWVQVEARVNHFFDLSKHVSLGLNASGIYSSKGLLGSYDASIVSANSFNPTPSSYNSFNPNLRANSFLTAGISPVWKVSSTVQFRGLFDCFAPIKSIELKPGTYESQWGKAFHNLELIGELSAVVALPFGTISAYGHYVTTPGDHWNFGISIGTFLLAPKFLH